MSNLDSAVRSATAEIDAAVAAATGAFAAGHRDYILAVDQSPRHWTAREVRLARLLARDDSYLEYASQLIEDARAELSDLRDNEATRAALDEAQGLVDAWSFPIADALCQSRFPIAASGEQLFQLSTYISHSPGLEWSMNHWVRSVTDRCAVYVQFDNMEDYPIFPVPAALIDTRVLMPAIGGVLRTLGGGGSWFSSRYDEVRSSLSVADLFKVLLYASDLAGDEIWTKSPRELAAVRTDGNWGYRELAEDLDRTL